MSIRLQVLVAETEMEEIRRSAQREHLAVGEWVRRAIREARSRQPLAEPHVKLQAVRQAAALSFPTADIDQMLREIESGYGE